MLTCWSLCSSLLSLHPSCGSGQQRIDYHVGKSSCVCGCGTETCTLTLSAKQCIFDTQDCCLKAHLAWKRSPEEAEEESLRIRNDSFSGKVLAQFLVLSAASSPPLGLALFPLKCLS